MKIIRSLLLFAVGFCTTNLLYAQEVKSDIAKPLEVKIPATSSNKTAPPPQLKQQSAPDAAAVPSPATHKAEPQPQEVKTLNKNDIATPGGEEGKKIMAGKATRPEDPIYSPSTADAKPAAPVARSSASNQQQQ